MNSLQRHALAALTMPIAIFLSACGTPGAPQPPSLNLPDPVGDLAAVRTGSKVSLTWTMPRRTTERTPLKSDIEVRICRREDTGTCEPVGGAITLSPGQSGNL